MWYTAFSFVKPAEFDSTLSEHYIYQRRNFQQVTFHNDLGDYQQWQYEECKLPKDEFMQSRIQALEDENLQLQLALTELYEEFLEG